MSMDISVSSMCSSQLLRLLSDAEPLVEVEVDMGVQTSIGELTNGTDWRSLFNTNWQSEGEVHWD